MTTVGLIGDRQGFPHVGGIRTLALLLQQQLRIVGIDILVIHPHLPIPQTIESLVIIGCSSPWAYGLAIASRIRQPGRSIHWIPCFHPPAFVRHKWKSRIARLFLRRMQHLGINVHALSEAERIQLAAGRCSLISLPFSVESHRSPALPAAAGTLSDADHSCRRSYDLVFLGRPVEQKGWSQFIQLVSMLPGVGLALVPSSPRGRIPPNLEVVVAAGNEAIAGYLREAKILFLPSDYESFGFAQVEALMAGCCVPILGEWPLWLDVPELDWRGLSIESWQRQLLQLIVDDQRREELVLRQSQAWAGRPERQAPLLPPFPGEGNS